MFYNRNIHLEKIQSLDPIKDCEEIVRISVMYEFPWDYNRAMELALYKTYAVPSISKILHLSGEFERNVSKRYDDTDILLSEIMENGFSSKKGEEYIEYMNWIHSHYPIKNVDYLYVLSTFIYESERWINRFGYRKLCRNEEIAGFYFWQEVGKRMGIQDIPKDIDSFRKFNEEYELEHFQYSPNNVKIATLTENLMLSWFIPKALYPIGRPFIHSIMEPSLLKAFQHPTPHPIIKNLTENVLRFRGNIVRLLPPRTQAFSRTGNHYKHDFYPNGYTKDDIGPENIKKKTACPYRAVKKYFETNDLSNTV